MQLNFVYRWVANTSRSNSRQLGFWEVFSMFGSKNLQMGQFEGRSNRSDPIRPRALSGDQPCQKRCHHCCHSGLREGILQEEFDVFFFPLPSGSLTYSYWKWTFYTWWFSIAMLVYQRVKPIVISDFQLRPPFIRDFPMKSPIFRWFSLL